jgi:hypothetical protein
MGEPPPTGADLPARSASGTPAVSERLDQAVQRIFTAGLLLSGAAHRSTPEVAAAVEQAIDDLDDALRDIRADLVAGPAAARVTPVWP